ncbi:RibD family protein [Salinarimonas soli]|uniref:RibD family protein n=1 Tax=Salinarimonas soli TaxID=1638099 RepID=UPI001F0A9569|nr:RibD family protein [Salinarimonas soli]
MSHPFDPFPCGTAEQPFVIAQLGQSLDGRIATPTGDSKYINGGAALDHLHAIRARVDAVLVGIGTVVADDPLLTVRRVPGRSPARVILDPSGRLPCDARVLADDGVPRIVITRPGAPVAQGADCIAIEADGGVIPPRAILRALGACGFRRILVEGGARTISAFMDAGLVDRLHVLVAPLILGSGRNGLDLAPIGPLSQALRPRARAHLLADGNVLFDCDLSAGRLPSEPLSALAPWEA